MIVMFGCVLFWFLCIQQPGESFVRMPEQSQIEQQDELATGTSAQQETGAAKSTKTAPGAIGAPSTQQDAQKSSAKKQSFDFQARLEKHVEHLATKIGERNLGKYKALCDAADYIESELKSFGYQPKRQTYQVLGRDCFNIEAEIKGTKKPDEIVIIGGHYDSVRGTPGANDNGSGTAAMLVLAEQFKKSKPEKTLRFVAWTNEEPPYFQNRGEMGSWVYAEKCSKEKQDIAAVLSLETMGYFTDEKDSQKYPPPLNLLYPSTGNFIGFVGNRGSAQLQRRAIKVFREHAKVPSEGASLPGSIQGVGWSDHWSFWKEGYVGIMITDTAPFRYPHYHRATDTPDQLNFPEMTKVVDGLVYVVEDLVAVAKDKIDEPDPGKEKGK